MKKLKTRIPTTHNIGIGHSGATYDTNYKIVSFFLKNELVIFL
jgi:hypothetical protein